MAKDQIVHYLAMAFSCAMLFGGAINQIVPRYEKYSTRHESVYSYYTCFGVGQDYKRQAPPEYTGYDGIAKEMVRECQRKIEKEMLEKYPDEVGYRRIQF
jgi:hypothetical protein